MNILYSPRKTDGAVVVGGKHISDTLQCGHCGKHEVIVPGSGKKRGLCSRCKKFLCGKLQCMQVCIPFEKRLEMEEKQTNFNRRVFRP